MSPATKIPPHVARELRRHLVRPKPTAAKATKNPNYTSAFWGSLALLGFSFSIPYLSMLWIGPLNDRDDPLTASQIRRGAFNNSGSRDAGKDPNWDFSKGTYIKDKSFEELFQRDDPNEIDHGEGYAERR